MFEANDGGSKQIELGSLYVISTNTRLKFHPVCRCFPDISGEEFDQLKLDIERNGQRNPIVVHKGHIIDGKNRYRACTELGIAPMVVEWDGQGESVVAWAVSTNLHRRHMSPSQRAAVAAELAPLFEQEAKARQRRGTLAPIGDKRMKSSEAAAKAAGATPRSTQRAIAVKKVAPDAFAQVKAGEKTVSAAESEIRKAKSVTNDPTPAQDALGRPLPERFREVFESQEFVEITLAIQRIRRRVKKLCATHLGLQIHAQTADAMLQNAMQLIKHARPYVVCGYCRGTGKSCKVCKRQGWITKLIYDSAPPEVKAAEV